MYSQNNRHNREYIPIQTTKMGSKHLSMYTTLRKCHIATYDGPVHLRFFSIYLVLSLDWFGRNPRDIYVTIALGCSTITSTHRFNPLRASLNNLSSTSECFWIKLYIVQQAIINNCWYHSRYGGIFLVDAVFGMVNSQGKTMSPDSIAFCNLQNKVHIKRMRRMLAGRISSDA
jgi:hypothetical protein